MQILFFEELILSLARRIYFLTKNNLITMKVKMNLSQIAKATKALDRKSMSTVKGGALGDPPPFGVFERKSALGDPPPFGVFER